MPTRTPEHRLARSKRRRRFDDQGHRLPPWGLTGPVRFLLYLAAAVLAAVILAHFTNR